MADKEGADKEGADKEGADKEGADKEGADKEGADKEEADKAVRAGFAPKSVDGMAACAQMVVAAAIGARLGLQFQHIGHI
jgi:hypothetical protein